MYLIKTSCKYESAVPSAKYTKARPWRSIGWISILALAIQFPLFSTAQALMGGNGLMWTVWQSEPLEVVVCWENPSAADPLVGEIDQTSGLQRREWVRLALKRSWEREARINFVGWQQCQNETNPATPPHTFGPRRPGTADENIKINIKTTCECGQNSGHGSWGDYQQEGVTLDLHCNSQSCMENIEYLAIHEIGHVLGFYHGEERSDWNIAGCAQQTYSPSYPWWPVPTERLWGKPDRDSIMAYCSGGPTSLSPIDVAGVQRAYGRHLPGTLLSLPGSLCLSAHANAANGDPAFGWACDENLDDQEWEFDVTKGSLYIQSPSDPLNTRRCLDVDSTNYNDVQIWDCLNSENQQWQFKQTMVRGYGGLCLTRSTTGPLTMQPCTGAYNQMWQVEKSQTDGFVRLRAESANQCLTLDGESGSFAKVTPCSPSRIFAPIMVEPTTTANKKVAMVHLPGKPLTGVRDFYLGAGGSLYVPGPMSSSLCLDVRDAWNSDFINGTGGPIAGQAVQFFTCYTDQLNQKWSFSGHLVSENKCLSLSGNAVNNGASAIVTDCSTSNTQNWDYIW